MKNKIRRILITDNFSNPWNLGFYIQRGLQQNDVEVRIFDPRTAKNPHAELMAEMDSFSPSVLLHIKDRGLRVEWLKEAKERGIATVQWYPDIAMPEWLIPYVKNTDIFFTMAEGLVEEFKKYNLRTFWLTQAFEPSFFQISDITPEDISNVASDVTFIGTPGSKEYYLKRRRYLSRVIDEGFKLRWWGPRLPRKLSTIPLVFGRLGRAYGGRFIWGEEYAKAAKLSKVFLAFDAAPHIRKSMSDRMYIAVGCGAFYMCQHVDGIEDLFVPDKEIVTFRNEDEMIDKIRFYLKNDSPRKQVADAGKTRALKDHTYKVRTGQMLRILEDVLG